MRKLRFYDTLFNIFRKKLLRGSSNVFFESYRIPDVKIGTTKFMDT